MLSKRVSGGGGVFNVLAILLLNVGGGGSEDKQYRIFVILCLTQNLMKFRGHHKTCKSTLFFF